MAGKAEKKLEVLADITRAQIEELNAYLQTASFFGDSFQSGCVFDIFVEVRNERAQCRGADSGTSHEYCKNPKRRGNSFWKEYTENTREKRRIEAF